MPDSGGWLSASRDLPDLMIRARDNGAMDYCAVDETQLVKSRTVTGSMATAYDPMPVRVHAVPVEDGAAADRAVCGFRYRGDRLSEVPFDWQEVPFGARCQKCAQALGGPHAIAGR